VNPIQAKVAIIIPSVKSILCPLYLYLLFLKLIKTINNNVGTGDATLFEKPTLFKLPTNIKLSRGFKMKNIIYKAKNEERKCFYIGYSSRGLKPRQHRHKQSCFKLKTKTKFYNFVRKYGWDSFTWEILAVYSTKEELPQAEIDWLVEQKKEFLNWECLNLTEGGDGLLNPSEEVRKKISAKMTGENNPNFNKKCPWVSKTNTQRLTGIKRPEISKMMSGKKRPEISKMMSGKNHPMFGKHHTEESKQKNREKHLGRVPWNKGVPCSEEQKEKIRKKLLGTHPTEFTRIKRSKSMKETLRHKKLNLN
jgi:group I intron endonuclease